MEQLDLTPGSPEWLAHRAVHFNASDAPVMMGVSKNRTRNELLQQLHSGIPTEFSDYVQERVIDPGHEFEALARPFAEEVIGEDLFPIVGTRPIKGLKHHISASFDGITMDERVNWEHKRLNNELRAVMTPRAKGADLPLEHQIQMEHQCLTSGAKRALFTASNWDGTTCLDIRHVWYTSNPELAERIVAGWVQFEADLAVYEPPRAKAAPVTGKVVKGLPALVVQTKGEVVKSNLEPYRVAALAYIATINTELKTDQDFVDADSDIKFCQESEDRLKLVKEQALAQTATIAEIFAVIDQLSASFGAKRILLTNRTKTRKTEIKQEIADEAQAKLDAHVKTLNERLGSQWIPRRTAAFGEAMKNKRTIESLHSAVDDLLATEKIALSATADRLGINRKALMDSDTDYIHLFADFATVGTKDTGDFSAIALQRIAIEKARVQKIIDDKRAADDAQRLKDQAAADAKKLADDAAAAAKVAEAPVAPVPAATPIAPVTLPVVGRLESTGGRGSGEFTGTGRIFQGIAPARKAPDTRPPLGTGELNALIGDGFSVSVPFITKLGFTPAPNPPGKHSGTYWAAGDVEGILLAIMMHVRNVAELFSGRPVDSAAVR